MYDQIQSYFIISSYIIFKQSLLLLLLYLAQFTQFQLNFNQNQLKSTHMQPQFINPLQIQTIIQKTQKNRDLFEQLLDEEYVNYSCKNVINEQMQVTRREYHEYNGLGRDNYKRKEQYQNNHQYNQDMIQQAQSLLSEPLNDQIHSHQGCKCTKIDCLKLYCECFAKGKICNQNCICVSCKNHSSNQSQIYQARQIANYRNPNFFKNIPPFIPIRKCTCKKSQCRKKYCECYSAGIKCTEECQCYSCENGKCNHKDQDRLFQIGITVHA